jgi:hypothetical protein
MVNPKDNFLTRLITELTGGFQKQLLGLKAAVEDDLRQAFLEMYSRAHRGGGLWQLLNLLVTLEAALENVFAANDLELNISDSLVLERIAKQASVATDRMLESRVAGGLQLAGAEARAAQYAARWGTQAGIRDAAEGSVVEVQGVAAEMLKEWVRLAARGEHRSHHDALIGVVIAYSEKFELQTPKKGTYRIHAPYDNDLPLSETINCGHGIRVEPPANSIITPWNGGVKKTP